MKDSILKIATPAISLVLVVLGSSLLTTLIPVRLQMDGYQALVIGLISSVYYGGFILGSFKSEHFVVRVGHIRAYTTFAALLAIVSLLHGLYFDIEGWLFLRFVSGYCTAGLFIVIESWFLASGSTKYRGRLLALYMMFLYAAQSGGQFLLRIAEPNSLILFCVVTIITCLSIIPLSTTYLKSPHVDSPSSLDLKTLYEASPTGVLGSFFSGVLLGCIYGLFPIYIMRVGYNVDDVAVIMGLLILGAMLIQYPVGKFSDQFDRRKILILLCVFVFVLSFFMILTSYLTKTSFSAVSMLFGGFVFVLYPLSISHACDYIEQKDTIGAVQGLLLFYGLGAVIGPMFGALCIYLLNPIGLFIYFMVIASFLGYFIHWRGYKRPSVDISEQQGFEIGANTTPIASEMDPRIEDENILES